MSLFKTFKTFCEKIHNQAPNGFSLPLYCDDNVFDKCSQVFKDNSSALSGYFTKQTPNGSLISVNFDDNAYYNYFISYKKKVAAAKFLYVHLNGICSNTVCVACFSSFIYLMKLYWVI